MPAACLQAASRCSSVVHQHLRQAVDSNAVFRLWTLPGDGFLLTYPQADLGVMPQLVRVLLLRCQRFLLQIVRYDQTVDVSEWLS